MQRSFVFKDKLVCTMKKKTMATVNIILEHGGVHAKIVNVSTITYPRQLNLVSVER